MFLSVVLLLVGFVLLIKGADVLVDGAASVARAMGVSTFVIGLTVVAFGTSAPEMAAAVKFSLSGEGGAVAGTVVGSNIANICLILGITALITPIRCESKVIRLEAPLMAVITLVAGYMLIDGTLGRIEGSMLLVGIVLYVLRSAGAKDTIGPEVEELAKEEESRHHTKPSIGKGLLLSLVGLVMLVGGAELLVRAVSEIASAIGVPEYIITLSVVAFGTSLPELVTSIQAARRGHAEMAVANVLGSNVFNLLAVLGLGALVAPLDIPAGVLSRDIWVMGAATAACLPIMLTGGRITRKEGGLLAAAYLAYVAVLFLHTTG